jgi:hypothetical protein
MSCEYNLAQNQAGFTWNFVDIVDSKTLETPAFQGRDLGLQPAGLHETTFMMQKGLARAG